LAVDPAKNHILVTHRQSLVDSKHPPLTSFEQALPGTVADGVITSVMDTALLVGFYNGVMALISKSETDFPDVDSLTSKYAVGQGVVCCITRAKPEEKRLWATLKVDAAPAKLVGVDWSFAEPGKTIKATVQVLKPYGASLTLADNKNVTGFVPKYQMSGDLKPNDSVKAFVLDVDKRKGIVDMSLSSNLVGSTPSHKVCCTCFFSSHYFCFFVFSFSFCIFCHFSRYGAQNKTSDELSTGTHRLTIHHSYMGAMMLCFMCNCHRDLSMRSKVTADV